MNVKKGVSCNFSTYCLWDSQDTFNTPDVLWLYSYRHFKHKVHIMYQICTRARHILNKVCGWHRYAWFAPSVLSSAFARIVMLCACLLFADIWMKDNICEGSACNWTYIVQVLPIGSTTLKLLHFRGNTSGRLEMWHTYQEEGEIMELKINHSYVVNTGITFLVILSACFWCFILV